MKKSIISSVLSCASIFFLAFTGTANAGKISAEKGGDRAAAIIAAGDVLCKTFTGAPQVSISKEGNILLFQGANQQDHIYDEGYSLCSSGVSRYSNVFGDVGFGPATCNCVGNTCKVTRNTTDGKMSLVQELSKPTNLDRSFNIKMTVKNLTGANVNGVILRRFANIDINSVFDEWHHSVRDSSSAWGTENAGIPYAVRLRHITRAPATTTYDAKTTPLGDTGCTPSDLTAGDPIHGDYNSTIQYGMGTIGPNASKSVTVQYLRD
ncbi:MAG: hypothetical protein LM517_07955 [Nitrosomonas sp.]|nr:hypothetical protein [Nitrosomonas sp.]